MLVTPLPDVELERVWRTLAAENGWLKGHCPISERRQWICAISTMTQATMERVERIGVAAGVVSPHPESWDLPALVDKVSHEETPRQCKHCGQAFTGKGRAEYCGRFCKDQAFTHSGPFITSTQAGEILGVHRQRVIDFHRAGKLTRHEDAKGSRWCPQEVARLAQEMKGKVAS